MTEVRMAWVGTCVFWAWTWAIGSLVWVPMTLGLSLFGLLLAGGSVWAIWIPVGRPPAHPTMYYPVPQQSQGYYPQYPATPPGQ